MQIFEDNQASLKDFIRVNVDINRPFENYIRPLDNDVKAVFDPKKNKLLKKGKAQRWILKDDQGKMIGRIAAFVNTRYKNKGDKVKPGGFGFFDCIDNQEAANMLFDTAKKWLEDQGFEAMDGPINFGDRDRFWGLLLEGFHPPQYGIAHNPPYYQKLFEAYGMELFYKQNCWGLPLSEDDQLEPKFYEAHAKYAADPDFRAEHYDKKQIEKYATAFCEVYNAAWAGHDGNKEMSVKQGISLFKSMHPIINEYLVWFVYHKDKPVALWVNLPDINQVFKHLNGQFDWWHKLKFLMIRKSKMGPGFIGIVFGVIPEFQGKGVDYFMIVEGERSMKANTNFRSLELQWQGDFNPKMNNISKNLGAVQARVLATYRYQFDRDLPFERHPIVG